MHVGGHGKLVGLKCLGVTFIFYIPPCVIAFWNDKFSIRPLMSHLPSTETDINPLAPVTDGPLRGLLCREAELMVLWPPWLSYSGHMIRKFPIANGDREHSVTVPGACKAALSAQHCRRYCTQICDQSAPRPGHWEAAYLRALGDKRLKKFKTTKMSYLHVL